jgi:orotidine-5'-phosphate decarboxylase
MADASEPGTSGPQHFADQLIETVRKHGHPLCLGLDPHLESVPALFWPKTRGGKPAASEVRRDLAAASAAVHRFLDAVLERAGGRVAIVKPQSAFFEQLGWRGTQVLGLVCDKARVRGMQVLLDAKRGDIGSTAEAYARAYLDPEGDVRADALTVNPFLGLDTLAPFHERVRQHGRGLFVLLATSNPGAAALQDQRVEPDRTLSEWIATQLRAEAEAARGPATGWSSVGAVIGATRPQTMERLRETLPHSVFLIPGFGAQGGDAESAVRGFVAGPTGLEGGIVNASRSVLFAEGDDGVDAPEWERRLDARLDAAISALAEVVQR